MIDYINRMRAYQTNNLISSIFTFTVFVLTIVLIIAVQCQAHKKEEERRRHMLNFAPSGRTS